MGRDEAVPTPRSLWSSGSRTGRSGILLNILSDASECSKVEQVEVEVVVPSESDDDVPDILREPSKHLPGRREEECLVGGRSTTEKILSAFGYSYTGQSADGTSGASGTASGPSGRSAPSARSGPSPSGRSGRTGTSVQSTRTNPPSLPRLPSLEARPSAPRISEGSKDIKDSVPKERWSRWRCRCVFCSFFGLALGSGISVALFWPRHPSWELKKLEVDDGIMELVTAMSAIDTVDTVAAPSQLLFTAESAVSNPNLLHGDTSDGSIELRYVETVQTVGEGVEESEFVVGRGVSYATTLAPQTVSTVMANITVDLEQNFVNILQREIVAERLVLAFKLIAACKVVTILNVQLHYQMVCDLDVALSDLMMSETRTRAVAVKACKHSFS